MEYRCGEIKRVFWVRFEDGEDLRAGLEHLAEREQIHQALVLVLGGMGQARMVLGPLKKTIPPEPNWASFADGREILGVGTLAHGPQGPSLHLHLAAGRGGEPTLAGCLRAESEVYLIAEAVVLETSGLAAVRKADGASGLNLLAFD